MKKILTLCAFAFTLPALADHVLTLPPGASLQVYDTTVRCLGAVQNPDAPKCGVRNYSGHTYSIYVGTNEWGRMEGFENAVAVVMRLKESGMCN